MQLGFQPDHTIPVLPLPRAFILGQLLHLLRPQFPHLDDGIMTDSGPSCCGDKFVNTCQNSDSVWLVINKHWLLWFVLPFRSGTSYSALPWRSQRRGGGNKFSGGREEERERAYFETSLILTFSQRTDLL